MEAAVWWSTWIQLRTYMDKAHHDRYKLCNSAQSSWQSTTKASTQQCSSNSPGWCWTHWSTVECSNVATPKWVACGNHVCVFVLLYLTEHGEQIQQGFPRPFLVLYRHSKSAHKTSGLVWPPVGPANTVAGLSCLRRQPHCDQSCVKWTLLVCGQCEINVLSQRMLCEPVHTSSTVHRTYIRIHLRCIKISASTEVSSDVKSKLQHVQMHMLQ